MDKWAFIDIETTGGRAGSDRITEVAIQVVADGRVVDSWQSLVNPECAIPVFIQRLTGIDDEKVRDAPRFAELAEEIAARTQGCVFVAHNARFDYAFIKAEFRRLERRFTRRVFCTVKLAKLLYPEHRGHGLDKLIARHALPCSSRHRAMGDVEAMLAFFRFAQQDVGQARFDAACQQLLKRPSLPLGLDESKLNALPEAPGVFHFYGDNDVLLYVGKSVNVYQRVLSHFSADHRSQKEMVLSQSVRSLKSFVCAGEIDALLLEIEHVKRYQPVHNRRLRPSQRYFTYLLANNAQGYLTPKLRELDINVLREEGIAIEQCIGLYRTKGAARKALQKWFQANPLCAKLMGQDSSAGPCFARHLGTCEGACQGEEDAERYNLRVNIALHRDRLKAWSYSRPVLLLEQHDDTSIQTAYVIDQWCVLKRVDISQSDFAQDLTQQIEEAAYRAPNEERYCFDADVYRVLSRYLSKPAKGRKVISIGDAVGEAELK